MSDPDQDSQAEEVRGKGKREDGGGRIHMSDGRVTSALHWFWGALGTLGVTLLGIAANNLYNLNVTVARGLDADATRDARIQDHEVRLRQVERDVNTLEGRNLRGEPKLEEPKRGH
jgi:hypothetical protein